MLCAPCSPRCKGEGDGSESKDTLLDLQGLISDLYQRKSFERTNDTLATLHGAPGFCVIL